MFKNIYTLYVLKCENDNYYVGVTANMKHRFQQHRAGVGARFTARHKPISIFDQVALGEMTIEEAENYEDARTLELIQAIGLKHVRGGKFFSGNAKRKTLRRKYDLLDDKYKNLSTRFPEKIKKPKKNRAHNPWANQIAVASRELARSHRLRGI